MGDSCLVNTKVKNKQGEEINSPLFENILQYTNDRNWAVDIYEYTKTNNFRDRFGSKISRNQDISNQDGTNEYIFESLLDNVNIFRLLDEKQFMDLISKQFGIKTQKKGVEKGFTFDQSQKIQQKFRDKYGDWYNLNRVKYYIGPNKVQMFKLVVVPKNPEQNINSRALVQRNKELNRKIAGMLQRYGVGIGAINSLEERLGINGVMDPTSTQIVNGLRTLIRIANNEEGEAALPEEFAHFVVDALGSSHPLVQRLINAVQDDIQNILGDSYTKYSSLYKGNKELLAKEAVGKLLAAHIKNNNSVKDYRYQTLVQRLWQAVKNFFRRIPISDVDAIFSQAATDIMDGRVDKDINLKNLSTDKLYNTDNKVNRDKELLQKIIDTQIKRLKIYSQRSQSKTYEPKQEQLIMELEDALGSNQELEGMFTYLQYALGELKQIDSRLKALYNDRDKETSINSTAKTLRDIRNFLSSHKGILEDLREQLREEELQGEDRMAAKLAARLGETLVLSENLWSDYNRLGLPLFSKFISGIVGKSLKYKGQTIDINKLLTVAEEDISLFDRWLDAAADSSDGMVRILDQIVKKAKQTARLESLEINKQLQAADLELRNSGVNNTEWMFARNKNGDITGYYIDKVDWSKYYEELAKFRQSIKDKFGDKPSERDIGIIQKEKCRWLNNNREKVGNTWMPRMSIYESKQFKALTPAQLKYYNTVMEIKAKLDSYLPEGATRNSQAVMIRKDMVERIKSSAKSGNIKDILSTISESIKDTFISREDDVEWGTKSAIKDFENRAVKVLPIYYTKKLNNLQDLSLDVTSTMAAYSLMANDYKQMNSVLDVLELGRDLSRDRKILEKQGNKTLTEQLNYFGRKITSNIFKSGAESQAQGRIDDLFTMQVYGEYQKDQGTIRGTKISKGKLANFLNRLVSINNMALSLLSGTVNVLTGKVMMRTEAISGEFFNYKDLLVADATYGKELPKFLSEIGNKVKVGKLALFAELFDVMQDYEQEYRNLEMDKGKFARLFSLNTLFFMNNAGEHYMQSRTALALANATKLKAPNGKTVSLWDALEVVPIMSNGKQTGAKLQIKKGYTKLDGTEFGDEDILKFSKKAAKINQRLHGIYNKADRSAIQQGALGRMAIMFRKWIKPSLNRRFASSKFDYDLDEWTEGYYNTFGKFIIQMAQDLKAGKASLIANWNKLDNHQKSNMLRVVGEVAQFATILLLLGLIDWSDDDDDKNWLMSMAEYCLRRLKIEVGVLIPSQYMFTEVKTILKTPAAAVDYIDKVSNLLNFFGYFDVVDRGRYKGSYRIVKDLWELVPLNRTLYKGFHPEESLSYYK